MGDSKAPGRTVTRVTFSDEFFDFACAAIHSESLKHRRCMTLRATVISGLDNLINTTRYDRGILLRKWTGKEIQGTFQTLLAFNAAERRLIREIQNLLQEQSPTNVSITQTIIMALQTISVKLAGKPK